MAALGRALFETAIGPCGIAWSDEGIVAILLPEKSEAATRAKLARRAPQARDDLPAPAEIDEAIAAIRSLLEGEPTDLTKVRVDLDGVEPFGREVYAVARTIEPGCTLTYGEVAARIGDPTAARAVGAALGRNPVPIVVPCHRVLATGAGSGGFSAPGGRATKLRLLAIEDAAPGGQPSLLAPLEREPAAASAERPR